MKTLCELEHLAEFSLGENDPPTQKIIHHLQINTFNSFSLENELKNSEKVKKYSDENNDKMPNSNPSATDAVCNIIKTSLRQVALSKRRKLICEHEKFLPEERKKINSRFFKLMTTLFFVKKFIKKLREKANIYDLSALGAPHFELIKDWSYYLGANNFNRLFNVSIFKPRYLFEKVLPQRNLHFLEGFKRFSQSFSDFVIPPTNNWLLLWEFSQILLNLAYFVMIPLSLGFEVELLDLTLEFNLLALILFSLDFIVNFNVAYYCKGELIVSKALIFQFYFKGRFFYDLMSLAFPFLNGVIGVTVSNNFLKVTAILFILRIKKLSKAISRFEDFLFSDEKIDNIISFLKLIFVILLFSHWSACFWILIGKKEVSNGWLWVYKLDDQSDLSQYIHAFYYVVVVINTVGFGDIVSTTPLEKLFTIVFIYIACVVFAFTLNRIGMILQNINRNERELKTNLNLINGFMKSKNIDFRLKIKIKNYLEYIWQEEKNQNQKETQEIIDRLSKSLKEELLLNANGKFIRETKVLNQNFTEGTLRKFVSALKEVNFTPGDIIYSENDLNDQNFYIIRDGEIELFLNTPNGKRRTLLSILKKGQTFGEVTFFSEVPCISSAKAVSFSSLFVLKKEDFMQIIRQNPEDFERFCEIRDHITLYHDFSRLFLSCKSCEAVSHGLDCCPLVHLNLWKENIAERYNHCKPQERMVFMRRAKKRALNARINHNQIQRKAIRFIDELFRPQSAVLDGTLEYFESIKTLKEETDLDVSNQKASLSQELVSLKVISPIKVEEKTFERLNSGPSALLRKKSLSKNNLKVGEISEEESEEKKEFLRMKSGSFQNFDMNNKMEQILLIDRRTFELDSVRKYHFYWRDQNIDELIEKLNRISEKKRKRLKSMFSLFTSQNIISSQASLQVKTRVNRTAEKSFFGKKKSSLLFGHRMRAIFKGKNKNQEKKKRTCWRIFQAFLNVLKKKIHK